MTISVKAGPHLFKKDIYTCTRHQDTDTNPVVLRIPPNKTSDLAAKRQKPKLYQNNRLASPAKRGGCSRKHFSKNRRIRKLQRVNSERTRIQRCSAKLKRAFRQTNKNSYIHDVVAKASFPVVDRHKISIRELITMTGTLWKTKVIWKKLEHKLKKRKKWEKKIELSFFVQKNLVRQVVKWGVKFVQFRVILHNFCTLHSHKGTDWQFQSSQRERRSKGVWVTVDFRTILPSPSGSSSSVHYMY